MTTENINLHTIESWKDVRCVAVAEAVESRGGDGGQEPVPRIRGAQTAHTPMWFGRQWTPWGGGKRHVDPRLPSNCRQIIKLNGWRNQNQMVALNLRIFYEKNIEWNDQNKSVNTRGKKQTNYKSRNFEELFVQVMTVYGPRSGCMPEWMAPAAC